MISPQIQTPAIYLRGSDRSRQEILCREYCRLYYGESAATAAQVYTEEYGQQRPQLTALLSELDHIEAVVCSRLDCICRNAGELADLTAQLAKKGILFVAVEEQITTAAPLGRAMTYLATVLKNLERQGASERVRIGMLELAKDGRWLGGVTPTGYSSHRVAKGEFALEALPGEASTVQLIFAAFLELNSLAKVERRLEADGIRTKNGRGFSRFTIRQLLENPVYMQADGDAYAYFAQSGAELCSPAAAFDGSHGMMVYNKTAQQGKKPGKLREIGQWIVAVGRHQGLISGADWVQAQQLLDQNKSPAFHKPRSEHALLPGMLRCGCCGDFMRPKQTQRRTPEGEPVFIYLCQRKERSKSVECQIKNVSGNQLDRLVCSEIKHLSANSELLIEQLERNRREASLSPSAEAADLGKLQQRRQEIQENISRLVFSLVKTIDKTAYDYIIQQIDILHKEDAVLQTRINQHHILSAQHPLGAEQVDMVRDILRCFQSGLENQSVEQKRAALRTLVDKVVWDGAGVQIFLFGTVIDNIPMTNTAL